MVDTNRKGIWNTKCPRSDSDVENYRPNMYWKTHYSDMLFWTNHDTNSCAFIPLVFNKDCYINYVLGIQVARKREKCRSSRIKSCVFVKSFPLWQVWFFTCVASTLSWMGPRILCRKTLAQKLRLKTLTKIHFPPLHFVAINTMVCILVQITFIPLMPKIACCVCRLSAQKNKNTLSSLIS